MVVSTLPTNWNPNHTPTAAELAQVIAAIKLAQDQPCAIVRRAAVQSINSAAFTDVSFDAEDADNDNMWASSPNPTRVTIAHDGWYQVSFGVKWASSGAGVRAAGASLNGAVLDDIADERAALAGNERLSASGGVVLIAGDIIRLNVFQSSGAGLNVQARLAVVRVSGPGS